MYEEVVELARRYGQAWAARDADAITAMHTENSVFHVHDIGAPAVGRDAVRALIGGLLAAVPDVRFELRRAHFGKDHFVTEYVMSGTIEGKSFAIDGADIFTLGDGLVARKDSYLDWTSYEDQVGLDPVLGMKTMAG
jgi:hypothetical protein